MTFVDEEIASQPDCWLRAADLVTTALPSAGERVAVIGCGTSYYIGQSYAVLREQAGHGETDAFAASEFPTGRRYDRVLAITRSGTTTEVLDAVRALAPGVPSTAITADVTTPIADLATEVLALPFADERSVVQTRFATTTLALLRAQLGADIGQLAAEAKSALVEDLPDGALTATQHTVLGAGWTVGLANEGALKLREAALAWSESYPGKEYRHGPISIADERSLVWILGTPADGLIDDVARTGAKVETHERDAAAELIRIQRLAVALGRSKGLDPDQPRNLTRSVILT